jgi:hypothetical protein
VALPLVILGSARPNGETRKAVDIAFPPGTASLVILPNHAIGGYDYGHANAGDDFAAIPMSWLRRRRSSSPPRSIGTR